MRVFDGICCLDGDCPWFAVCKSIGPNASVMALEDLWKGDRVPGVLLMGCDL